MISLVIMIGMSSAVHGYVYSDYTWYTYNGHQYAITFDYNNWTGAEVEAVAVGGHLVTINDVAENAWLTGTFGGYYAQGWPGNTWSSLVWIGLELVDNQWSWVSGDPLAFEPPWWHSLAGGNHAYLHTSTHPNPGTWWDFPEHDTNPNGYPRGIIEISEPPCGFSDDFEGTTLDTSLWSVFVDALGQYHEPYVADGLLHSQGYHTRIDSIPAFAAPETGQSVVARARIRLAGIIQKFGFAPNPNERTGPITGYYFDTIEGPANTVRALAWFQPASGSEINLLDVEIPVTWYEFHEFAIERTPSEVIYSIDGQEVARVADAFAGALPVGVWNDRWSLMQTDWVGVNCEPEEPQLLFREKDTGIPGFDHVGLYPGNGDLIWESHLGYDVGSYWDPETSTVIDVENINGVQQEHSHGSFFHDSNDPCTSPVIDQDSVGIDPILAEQMIAAIESLSTSHYALEWFILAGTTRIQIPSLQKGLTGGFTCCGLMEWAAEESGYREGQGFVPNIIEWVLCLAPSVQRWCILGEGSIWDSAKKKLVGWFDPVDFILTDPLGRRLGCANGQTYNEIPDAFYTGDGDFEIFGVADKLPGDYTIEFFGVGQDYNSVISVIDQNEVVQEWTFSGHLDTNESILEILPENRPPVANAGGPYVAQATSWSGASVALDGTGSSDPDGDSITYEWDLDLSVDSDSDGEPNNDVDATEPTLTRVFPIGQTEISLVVTDEYGIRSQTDVATVTVSFIQVGIDIKPGSFPNAINLGSHGVIPVAFLTDEVFDASTIDPTTVTLRGEDFSDGMVKLRGKKDAPVPMSNLKDVDGDGDLDLVVHLETEKLAEYELEAICEIGALTFDGYVVSGSDTIKVVPQ